MIHHFTKGQKVSPRAEKFKYRGRIIATRGQTAQVRWHVHPVRGVDQQRWIPFKELEPVT